MTKELYDFIFQLRSSEFIHSTPESAKELIYHYMKGTNIHSYRFVSSKLDGELGCLSQDKIKDLRNMTIGINFILCQMAVEHNVDVEYAYGLSDYLINKIDSISAVAQFDELIDHICTSYKNLMDLNSRTAYGYPIDKCIHYIDQNLYAPLTAAQVANAMNLNPSYLTTIFRERVGTSLYQYIKNRKYIEAKLMLENTQRTIAEIAGALGYSSPSHFSNAFKSQTGVYPFAYRKAKTT